jgi:hypothetical protein
VVSCDHRTGRRTVLRRTTWELARHTRGVVIGDTVSAWAGRVWWVEAHVGRTQTVEKLRSVAALRPRSAASGRVVARLHRRVEVDPAAIGVAMLAGGRPVWVTDTGSLKQRVSTGRPARVVARGDVRLLRVEDGWTLNWVDSVASGVTSWSMELPEVLQPSSDERLARGIGVMVALTAGAVWINRRSRRA